MKVLGALFALYLIWGSTYLAISVALESMPPMVLASSRFVAAGVFLFVLLGKQWQSVRPAHWFSATLVGFLLIVGGNGLVTWAGQHVASGQAAVLVASTPLWLALWGMWRNGYPGHATLAGLGFSSLGVMVLMGAPSDWSLGTVALLLSSLSWAAGSVLSGVLPRPQGTVQFSAMTMLTAGFILGLISLGSGEGCPQEVSLAAWLAWLYLTVFGSVVGLTAYQWLLSRVSATLVSTHTYVNPVVALLLAYAVGESLPRQTPVATVLIVVGIALIGLQGVLFQRNTVPMGSPRTSI